MSILRYSNSVTVNDVADVTKHKERIMNNIFHSLKEKKIPAVSHDGNTISFNKKVQFTDSTGYNRWQIFQSFKLRNGHIFFQIREDNIDIQYETNLTNLTSLILLALPLLILFIVSFTELKLLGSLMLALIIDALTYFIGYSLIKSQFDTLVNENLVN